MVTASVDKNCGVVESLFTQHLQPMQKCPNGRLVVGFLEMIAHDVKFRLYKMVFLQSKHFSNHVTVILSMYSPETFISFRFVVGLSLKGIRFTLSMVRNANLVDICRILRG